MSLSSRLLSAAPKPIRSAAVSDTCEGFCDWLGLPISPAQREIVRVAYDGKPVGELGPVLFKLEPGTVVPKHVRRTVVGRIGGRGGKTWLLISVRMVWGALVRDLSTLQAGQRAAAPVFAPRDSLREEAMNYMLGVFRMRAELKDMLRLPRGAGDNETFHSFEIERPDGHFVTIEGGVITAGGTHGRGRTLTDGAIDEACLIRSAEYRVNDEEVYRAMAPRVLPDGQSLLMSTPWAETGLHYELFEANFGKPTTALAIHAPTETLNPTVTIREQVAIERKRNPENARREFDAIPMQGGTTVFFDASLVDACIDDSLNGGRKPEPGELVRAGADFGFRSDSSALAIVHMSDKIRLGELLELRPEPDKPLVPSETVRTFREQCLIHGASYVTADGHYREAIVEHLGTIGFADAPAAPHEAFVRARTLMREGRVRIPRNDRLIRQLREVEAQPTAGGGLRIHMPRWKTGGHGDLAQAFVLAVSALGGEQVREPEPERGTPEWEQALKEDRRREFNQSLPETRKYHQKQGWSQRRFK